MTMPKPSFSWALFCGVLCSGSAQAAPCPPPSGGRLVADNCQLTFPGGTIASGGSDFNAAVVAQNGGSIQVQGPIQITTAGHDASGVFMQTNGSVVFSASGNTIATIGDGAYGVHSFGPSSFSGQADITTSGTQAHAAFEDFGGTVTLSNSIFVTHGDRSMGAATQGSGVINLLGSNSILTTGDTAPGIYSLNTGSRINIDATGGTLGIQTSGTHSHGIMSQTGADISAIGPITISTTGEGSHGLNTVEPGSTLDVQDAAIHTEGSTAYGATASGTATLTLARATLETTGPSSHGLVVFDAGSSITASQVDVVTHAQAYGAWVGDGGLLTWNGGAVHTSGDGAVGLYAGGTQQGQGRLAATGVTVETQGLAAHGAVASNAGDLSLGGGAITTHGEQAVGLVAAQAGHLTASDVRVATTGAAGHGAVVLDGASLELQRTDIHASGASAMGLSSHASGGNAPVTVLLDGGSLRSDQSTAIRIAGSTAAITLRNGAVAESGAGQLMEVVALDGVPGSALLSANQATLRGGIVVDAAGGSVADLVLAQGSALTGAASGVRNMTVAASQWTVSGDSSITDTLVNAGVIGFSSPSAAGGGVSKGAAQAVSAAPGFKTLSVPNYVSQGGALVFNTYLEDDASPTDRLRITRTVAGATGVQVRNALGPGAVTTQGILVVDGGGSLGPGSFSLSAPVVAGPYEYTLQRGSLASGTAQNWYLRSTVDCSAPSAESPPCPAPAPPGPGPAPTPDPVPLPNYRAETSLYTAIAPLALQYGRSLLDTLHERAGDTPSPSEAADGVDGAGRRLGWGRVIGEQGKRDGGREGIYGGAGPSYDYQFAGVQLGADLLRREGAGGARDQAGVYAAFGHASVDVTHFNGRPAGVDRFDGYTLGGYWTHHGQNEGYADAVLQATWYDAKADSARGLPELKTQGLGLGASLEGGYPLLRSGPWRIEPQAQLVYQRVELDDADDLAATVLFRDIESLAARVGLRVAHAWPQDAAGAPGIRSVWARLSVWHEFLGDPVTQFSSRRGYIPFQADMSGSWGELKAGVSAQLRRTLSIHGSLGYTRGFDGTRQSWDGKLGLRLVW